MAVNFGLLDTSDVGAQFRAGMQDAENALARRQERELRTQEVESLKQRRQAETMESEAKARAAEAEAQARRDRQARLKDILVKNGHRPSRELYVTMMEEPEAQVRAVALQALRDLDAEEQEQVELQRLGLRGAPAPAAPMAPAAEPMGAPAAPTNALAPAAAAPAAPAAPVNAMAAPAGVTREMIQQMMLSPNANVRARGKALLDSLPKERQSQLLTPEEEAQKTRIAAAGRAPRAAGGGRSGGAVGTGGGNLVGEVGKGVIEIVDPETGEKRLVSRAEAVRLGAISAKEANVDAKAEAKADKEQKARNDTVELVNSLQTDYDELDRLGGMVNNQRGTISNIASRISSSGVGQLAGGAIGSKEQTQRDKINNTRLRLLNAIKNAEGTGVGSLNSNMELQTYLAALGDVTQSKQTIDDTLRKIKVLIDRAAASAPADPAAGGAPGKGRDIGGGFKLVD